MEKQHFKVNFTCKDIKFKSNDGNYIVMSIKNIEFENELYYKPLEEYVIKGYFKDVNINRGTCISSICEWDNTDKYGWQLSSLSSVVTLPSSLAGIISFLKHFCKGAGGSTAKNIVSVYKEDTLLKIKESEDNLTCIKGIGAVRAKKIRDSVIKHTAIEELSSFLYDAGISNYNDVYAVYSELKDGALECIKKDPYVLCNILRNGLFLADKIAMNMGIIPDPIIRLSYIIHYFLKERTSFGDMCMEISSLKAQIPSYISHIGIADTLVDENSLNEAIRRLELQLKIVIYTHNDTTYIYDYENFYIEDKTAYDLSKLLVDDNNYKTSLFTTEHLQHFFSSYEKENNINLGPEQKKAVISSATNRFSIITGGAGVGKTLTIRALISLLEKNSMSYILTAPTGRAAKKMTEVTGISAYTLHRLLYIGADDSIDIDEIDINCNYIICDESSMISATIFKSLIYVCTEKNISLVLVGDHNQLPPVGKGFVFNELIKSSIIPVTKLTKLYRQAENSQIYNNALKVLKGVKYNDPDGLTFKLEKQDFFFFSTQTQNATKNLILKCVNNLMSLGMTMDDIVILSPMAKSALGSIELNKFIQSCINTHKDGDIEFSNSKYVFRVGDKVMQIKNNYQIEVSDERGNKNFGVFNGDIGIIENIDLDNDLFTIKYDNGVMGTSHVTYNIDDADQISLAYALTVHKSQGCEFPCVILPYDYSFTNINRNMIYTSITRAKKRVIMLGEPDVMFKGIQKVDSTNIISNLNNMLENHYNNLKYIPKGA